MNRAERFCLRLQRIGITVELMGNFPWIYLRKVNGIEVQERFGGNHGFTAFMLHGRTGEVRWTDRQRVFIKVRELVHESRLKVSE